MSEPGSPRVHALDRRMLWLLGAIGLVSVVCSAARLVQLEGWWTLPAPIDGELLPRSGALTATWVALVLLTRRCGGRTVLVAVFGALVLAAAGAFPEPWAVAGAAAVSAGVFGASGMVLTRPAQGWRLLLELAVSALVGLTGAVVVTGLGASLRPYRFRVLVLALVLAGALALAWKLGQGPGSLGRRGAVLIVTGVVVLAAAFAYLHALHSWASPSVVADLVDLKTWVRDTLGASPRPTEAIVGFPALVWGVSIRQRRRQGWWMCAFGSLGSTGLAASLSQTSLPLTESLRATGYDAVIGAALGLLLIAVDRLLTGRGGHRVARGVVEVERPEPSRFAPLL
ncbi:MAG: hypothetical protein ACR2LE_03500 [Nocardioidaceae bacterium]